MIAVVVINFGDTAVTQACLSSLYENAGAAFHLIVIDNASDARSQSALRHALEARQDVTLIFNSDNRGFAAGCNQAIATVLEDPSLEAVALLNNDTLVQPGWLAEMVAALESKADMDMVAARMMRFDAPSKVDSLGIVFYKSGIASNRKHESQPLLGPCGGAALYSARLLRRLQEKTGYIFDPTFFCYAEDTDLALRARALGYRCAYADRATVLHRGGHSSGGGYNELIAYYGLRNSLFALFKNLPASFLLSNAIWLIAMQAAVVFKYLLKGKISLLWRVYRDTLKGLPRVLRARRALRQRPASDWAIYCSKQFYDRDYILAGLRTLHKRDIRPARD